MRKHPKQAFGIFHDGLVVRIAHLVREGNDVFLQAVDHTDLDKYWYKILDDPSVSAVDSKTKESKSTAQSAIDIDEYDSEYETNYQLQPSERMLGAFELSRGVIALNVYDENILKDSPGAVDKKEISRFVKSKVPLKEQKAKDYQSSIVEVGGVPQHWLHHGSNRLLELLKDHSRNNRQKLFYKLADANDIVLTDYFKLTYRDELEGRVMLVYLGQEYRKAFLFEDGTWQQTLKLQITQSIPDEETISSKLALAIDSSGIKEPDRIILCGDLATSTLVEYMLSQFAAVQIELFNFRNIILTATTEEAQDNRSLSKHCIPIALAFKALFMDENGFAHSNFLPSKIIEGQKEFKIAWHGLLILIAIFATVFLATNSFLKRNQQLESERRLKRELNLNLNQKQAEANRINTILSDMEKQEKNLKAIGTLLEGKNYWTHLLDMINASFRAHPTSWLTNLKRDKSQLFISGVTSNRAHVIAFANSLPGSSIRKVAHARIRDNDIWVFEITFTAPKVAWMEDIEQQMREMLESRKQSGESATTATPATSNELKSVVPAQVVETNLQPKPPAATKPVQAQVQKLHLAPIDSSLSPDADPAILAIDEGISEQYQSFVAAVNMGNMWEYRKQGYRFLSVNGSHPLSPIVRWWMAYRLYLDREYTLAQEFLNENLNGSSDLHTISLLLQARLYLARGDASYIELYDSLDHETQGTDLHIQVLKDKQEIAKGGLK
ncbi:MAG TPA: hypothetical protein P5342_00750 [Candidatus Cloacimonadota bacterium]|nr:hypothetical protein [Candidatus Cloacimonadota bacterium]